MEPPVLFIIQTPRFFHQIMKKLLFVVIVLAIMACEKNPSKIFKGTYKVSGTVEKCPFVQGSTINMQTMDETLHATGKVFMETIKDDAGSFDFGSQEFDTPYAKITATGYFFNEVKGVLSQGMISLNTLVDLSDKSSVNVNLLTHLKSQRIQKLIESGNTFKVAASQAQLELMSAFGLQKYAGKDVSQFSIMSGTDEAAALIAVSSLIQVDRSEADMTEFISKLTNDFGVNGTFSKESKEALSLGRNKLKGQLSNIANNIVTRYRDLGKTITVKPLLYYFDWDANGVAGDEALPEGTNVSLDVNEINAPAEGGTYTVNISSPVTVYLNGNEESPISVISYETIDIYEDGAKKGMLLETILDNNVLTIIVKPAKFRLAGHIEIKLFDYLGTQLSSITVNQDPNPNAGLPTLNDTGRTLLNGVMQSVGRGVLAADRLQRMYTRNGSDVQLTIPLGGNDARLKQAWSATYSTIRTILSARQYDDAQLKIYGPLFDFYLALCYRGMSDLWGGLVYFKDMDDYQDYMNNSFRRTERAAIFGDLISRLEKTLDIVEDKRVYGCQLTLDDCFFMPKNFVKILLGYLLMEQGRYGDAEEYLQEVWESGYYSLNESLPEDASSGSSQYLFGMNQSSNTSQHFVIFSYGDVLLSLAECKFKNGDESSALALVNTVGTTKGWNSNKTDTKQVISYILELRKQEQYPSHFAFLKRNNLAQSELGITNDNWLLLPIPEDEITLTGGSITQNPGY